MDRDELAVLRDLVNAVRDIHGLAPVSDPVTVGEYDQTLAYARHEHAVGEHHRASDMGTARLAADREALVRFYRRG